MAKAARRDQGDFLHVLQGDKGTKPPAGKTAARPKKPSKGSTKSETASRKTPTSRRPRRQHSLSGLKRAWRGTRQQLTRRLKQLGKNLGRRRRGLVKHLKSPTTRRWLGRQVNWLILIGMILTAVTLAWGSHWLVKRRAEAGLEQLLALEKAVARGEEPDPALLENPWGWRPIRLKDHQGGLWLRVDGVSLSGCRTLIGQTRGRFAALTVNGQQAALQACDSAGNRLAFRVSPAF